MRMKKKYNYDRTDSSEIFKNKSLMAAENRKKMSKITYIVICVLTAAVLAACIFAYFFDKV